MPYRNGEDTSHFHRREAGNVNERGHGDGRSAAAPSLITEKQRGVVKWYNSRLCYGFLEKQNGDQATEIFVHRNNILMAIGETPFLMPDHVVMFDLWKLPDGRLEAQNVRSRLGKPISMKAEYPNSYRRNDRYAYEIDQCAAGDACEVCAGGPRCPCCGRFDGQTSSANTVTPLDDTTTPRGARRPSVARVPRLVIP